MENQVFPEESVTYRKLIDELLARGISAVSFAYGVRADEGAALVELLGDTRVSDIEAARSFLDARGVTSITVAETSSLDESGNEARSREVRARARETYDTGVSAMREIETQAKLGRMMEVGSLQRVVESVLDNLLQDPAAVIGLTAIKGHDDYTLNHSLNVCILALSLGSALGLSSEELRSLGLAALLYDIGKVRVSEDRPVQARPADGRGVAPGQEAHRGGRRPPQAPAARRQDADDRRVRAPPASRPHGLSRATGRL